METYLILNNTLYYLIFELLDCGHSAAMVDDVKGVKKVRSALHHRNSNHLKRKSCWKNAFSLGLLFLVMLFSVRHRV